jgi:hypothetical protein
MGGTRHTVHLLDTSRHRTAHHYGEASLLDVQVNAGDTALAHTHDAAILLTSISNREDPVTGAFHPTRIMRPKISLIRSAIRNQTSSGSSP